MKCDIRALTLISAVCFLAVGTSAQASLPNTPAETKYVRLYKQAFDKIGPSVGRNIVRDGYGPSYREPTQGEVKEAVGRLDATLHPPVTPTVATQPTGSTASPTLEAIAACESGGNPTAISAGGTYRGKYQFDYSTWASVGGSGDPAQASVAEQDMRAQMLYDQSGSAPWPVCGQ